MYELPCAFFFFMFGVGTGMEVFLSIMAATGSSMCWTACKTRHPDRAMTSDDADAVV